MYRSPLSTISYSTFLRARPKVRTTFALQGISLLGGPMLYILYTVYIQYKTRATIETWRYTAFWLTRFRNVMTLCAPLEHPNPLSILTSGKICAQKSIFQLNCCECVITQTNRRKFILCFAFFFFFWWIPIIT